MLGQFVKEVRCGVQGGKETLKFGIKCVDFISFVRFLAGMPQQRWPITVVP